MDFYNNSNENSGGYVFEQDRAQVDVNGIITKTYVYMLAVLFISGLFAYVTYSTGAAKEWIQNGTFIGLLIAEIIIVLAAMFTMKRNMVVPSSFLLVAYSIINGMTLSVIFLVYQMSSIVSIFFITAGLFGIMAFYGHTTKKDLTAFGSIMVMALMGLVLVTIVNIFFMKSKGLDLLLAYVGVGIFIGLTAYDAQKIKNMAYERSNYSPYTIAMFGALTLYLDFINLFLKLLRILGKRK